MLRKLNFTDRAKIARANVRVTLRRDADGVLSFDPQLSFDGVAVVATARVFIEAYYRTSFMRFDCGSIDAFKPPDDRRLTEIDGTSVVRFRVKVVDNSTNDHRIVAVADDIVVSAEQDETGGRMALLPVNFVDTLGQQAWRLVFESNEPVLELNNHIADIRNIARHDAGFFALVYPAALRQVLTQILLIDDHDPRDDGSDWWNLWLHWAAQLTDWIPNDRDERGPWIDDVVAAFCDRNTPLDRWNRTRAEAS